MSCGLIKFKGFVETPFPVLSKGKPSTTYSGVVLERKLPTPRIIISCEAPGSPLAEVTLTPATLPCKS